MGKWTDKLYITHSEWSNEYGGMSFGGAKTKKSTISMKPLPFDCCALSLKPFETPYATSEGHVFDLENIVPYMKEHGVNPVTGNKLEAKDLFPLIFHKNDEGKYCCPVTFKIFNEFTHIVAIKPSGQVYAYETVEKLNLQPKMFRDLVTDVSFKKEDIISIQDPKNMEKRNLLKFNHIKKAEKSNSNEKGSKINLSSSAKRILADAAKTTEPIKKKAILSEGKDNNDDSLVSLSNITPDAKIFSKGKVAASFTSMGMTPVTVNESALLSKEEMMFKNVKGSGYCSIKTNLGNLNLELFCEIAPKACYNFIMLAKQKYYDGTLFHRSIRNFMIQGGDPTGTGKGGSSYWKKDFEDEVKNSLSHDSRGMLCMANRGKNTNSSQFYITYRPCKHLDGKHTIFGKLVGGKDTLDSMERVETTKNDRPVEDIKIISIEIYEDPFTNYLEQVKHKNKPQGKVKDNSTNKNDTTNVFGATLLPLSNKKPATSIVGKYLKKSPIDSEKVNENESPNPSLTKGTIITKPKKGYGNFDNF